MYFKSPVEALYMMDNFKINLEQRISKTCSAPLDRFAMTHYVALWNSNFKELPKFYVKQESRAVFNPIDGDLGKVKYKIKSTAEKYYYLKDYYFAEYESISHDIKHRPLFETFMREEKLFFMPKKETNHD